MKNTPRFEAAVPKLYNAFHEDRLNAYSCTACAVGNICNNIADWSLNLCYNDYRLIIEPSLKESDFNGLFSSESVINSGYSLYELSKIEAIFLNKHRCIDLLVKEQVIEAQFNGLCAVVEYLCELDNIPNVMDYTKLFETENDKPKYQLSCS